MLDPAAWTRQLAYRPDTELPFDPTNVDDASALLPDSCFYIDALKGIIPDDVGDLVKSPARALLHSMICRAELLAGSAKLPLTDARTPASRVRIQSMLDRMPSERVYHPSTAAWDEAGSLAGTLARTQGLAKGAHLTLILDAAILLTAVERKAFVITANIRDFDLLLQLRPDARVLLYRPANSSPRGAPLELG
jgi:predicted nucleic acid-binding protein